MKTDLLKKMILFGMFCLSGLFIIVACTEETTEPDDPDSVGWAVGNENDNLGTILHTINKGLNWELQQSYLAENTDLYSVSAVSTTEAWVCGSAKGGFGLIMYTRDGGVNWQRAGVSGVIPNATLRSIVANASGEILVAGDSSTILKSIDGGTTWLPIPLEYIPRTNFQSITLSGNSAWAVGSAVDSNNILVGIILHSTNGGLTWERQADSIFIPYHLSDVQAIDDSIALISGWQQVFKTTNGGRTWNSIFYKAGVDLEDLCAVDVNNIWVSSNINAVYHIDGVIDTIHSPYPNSIITGVTAISDNQIWTCGSYGSSNMESLILFTNNSGSTWFFGQTKSKSIIRRMSFVEGVD